MHIKNKRGQSTVEYILLMTAVVAVMIVFATGNNPAGLQGQLGKTLNAAKDQMAGLTTRLSDSDAGGNGVSPYSNYSVNSMNSSFGY